MAVRRAMFAGSWYPAGADDCERQIAYFLEETILTVPIDQTLNRTVGVIVPHAGWDFSGGIACRAISLLAGGAFQPETIVLFGSHLGPKSRPWIMDRDALETPFGPLEVDTRLAEALTRQFAFQLEAADDVSPDSALDNTIELQLPFIKYFFPDARIVPIGSPPAPIAWKIGRFVAEAAGELDIPINVIGSTDLTHYGPRFGLTPYGTGERAHEQIRAKEDRRIIDLMLSMDPKEIIKEALLSHNACCAGAAAAAVTAGSALGAPQAHLTEYATSYEKSPGGSFVGYAGIIF